ncbi:MAG TPA: TIGR04255 family protein [Candidatus Atribacteria bacterium]|nr:TIGR04255 family protein [Candidatus Atribacteria bacterium]
MPKYPNNPIIEALCEFRFSVQEPWDVTIAGLIYQEIRDQFPQKKQDAGFEIKARPTEKGIEQLIEVIPSKIRFISEDGSKMVQLVPNSLVINHLRPYPVWDQFKKIIIENFKLYNKIAKPSEIIRIGLRYINKIYLPLGAKIEDYFNFYPTLPKELPQEIGKLNLRLEMPFGEEERLILWLREIPSEKDHSEEISFILDLDYISFQKRNPKNIGDIEDYLDKTNYNLYSAFENCLTEKCKEKFK